VLLIGGSRNSFEVHAGMGYKVVLVRTQKERRTAIRERFHLLRKHISNHKQNVTRQMDSKGHSDVSERNEE
jgi:hypothetical protein